ncbi:hypothetical protein [Aliivibrio logei]|uniref:hypothetical protein n=1 Tax=Aliivibrio logei TaxID=688 RepID=UPI0035C92742
MSKSHLLLRIRRKLIKKIIKLTHNSADYYKADYWPYVKEQNDSIYFKNKKIKTHNLLNLELGNHTVNIIGSGPSINGLDLSKIKSDNNIYLNGSINVAEKYNLPIFAHIIMDANFVYNRFDLIKQNTKNTNIILSLGALCAIAERDISILNNNKVYIFKTEKLSKDIIFTNDINNNIIDGGTVMSIAIQTVFHNNPKEAYLLGLDISNAKEPRFYENENNKQKCGLLKDYDEKILPFMKEASLKFKSNNIEIFNCSPISKLPFDIIPYSDRYEK